MNKVPSEYHHLSGIYRIVNTINGKCYVGSAVHFRLRRQMHVDSLRTGTHHSGHLQNAWNKYGEQNFVFEVLLVIEDKEKLIYFEQKYMDWYQSYEREFGYNISPTAGSCLGSKRTEETSRKQSRSLREMYRCMTETERLSRFAKLKGIPKSESARAKMSAYGKIRKYSPETRAKMSASASRRRASPETRKKMSEKIKQSWIERRRKKNGE